MLLWLLWKRFICLQHSSSSGFLSCTLIILKHFSSWHVTWTCGLNLVGHPSLRQHEWRDPVLTQLDFEGNDSSVWVSSFYVFSSIIQGVRTSLTVKWTALQHWGLDKLYCVFALVPPFRVLLADRNSAFSTLQTTAAAFRPVSRPLATILWCNACYAFSLLKIWCWFYKCCLKPPLPSSWSNAAWFP